MMFFRQGDGATVAGIGPNGALVAPFNCDVNSKPDPTDPLFMDLGAIEAVDPTVGQTDTELFKPAPGRLVLKDVKESKQKFSMKVTTNEVSSLAFETAFRTSEKLSGANRQFHQLGAVSRYGWIHIQAYDDTDTLILTLDQWCKIRTTMKFAMEAVKPEWEIIGLYSPLNVGLLGA
jgi:hypothetical protein